MTIPIVFTEEEVQKIEEHLDRYRATARAEAPDGTECYIHPGVRDFFVSFALRDLALELIAARKAASDPTQVTSLRERALRAQEKACAIGRLPMYRFELACMYEAAGEVSRSVQAFRDFLVEQANYEPDPVHAVVLNLIPYSVQDAIELAVARSV